MDEIEALPDRIFDNYRNTTIFLTGGSGFLGKVLIEKLLRSFDVKRIYILIRESKGRTPSARLQEIFSNKLFDKLRSSKGADVFEKCKAIVGDVTEDRLGLMDGDREILTKEVEYVIHSAATVRFNEPLRNAILINTKGTVSMIQFAKEMENLKLFIHVSTTYCHPELNVLKEITYPSKFNYEHMISLANWFDEDTLESMKSRFMEGIPNTYTFSKALSEDAVAGAMGTLPIVIMRPSIVISIWKEPLPGWNNNIFGIIGAFLAVGKGVLRTMIADSEVVPDFISVDVAVNNLLALGAYSVQNRIPTRVFNMSSHNYLRSTWNEIFNKCVPMSREVVPFDNFLWVPKIKLTTSKFVYYFMVMLFQLLPSLIIDTLLPLFGYKPFLWRTQMRLLDNLNVLQYYANNQWVFENHHVTNCRAWMNAKELGKYTLTHEDADIDEYVMNMLLGMRRYLLKEPDENIPKAKRLMRIIIWVDWIFNIIFKFIVAYLFYRLVLLIIYN